jgi:hypothetical protein
MRCASIAPGGSFLNLVGGHRDAANPASRNSAKIEVDRSEWLDFDTFQISKLRAFRECPRQKYSTSVRPLTIPK